jgi:hypothetical protein
MTQNHAPSPKKAANVDLKRLGAVLAVVRTRLSSEPLPFFVKATFNSQLAFGHSAE